MKNSKVLILLLIGGFIWSFVSGIFVTYLLFMSPKSTPPPPDSKKETIEEYDIVAVSEEQPHMMLVFDFIKRGEGFYGSGHYYNGASWESQVLTFKDSPVSDVASRNNSVNFISIETSINKNRFILDVPGIYTNMVIRAQEDYVKFGGSTQDSALYLTINNKPIKSYVALLKGYNFNYVEEDIEDLGVSTDWLIFWDRDWNFYHLDKTTVLNPSPYYSSHELFAAITKSENNFGTVSYFSGVDIERTKSGIRVHYLKEGQLQILGMLVDSGYKRFGYENMAHSYLATVDDRGIGLYMRLDSNKEGD